MITKEAESKTDNTKNQLYFNSAREGFAYLLSYLFQENRGKILLPSYIGITDTEGSGVFDPIIETKTNYEFYELNEGLAINKESLLKQLDASPDFKAILIIHYFGFCQNDLRWLKSVSEKYNLLMIEDCAHSLNGTKVNDVMLGTTGDFSLFSIHKVLPTNNGGILQFNNKKLNIPAKHNISYDELIQYCNADFELINEKRRKNYQDYLDNGLKDIKGIKLMFDFLPENTVPLNLPIIVQNGLREKLYFKLIDYNVITISLYYRIIEEINKNAFPVSSQISNSILNLPVHQDIEHHDILNIIKTIKKALK